MGKGYLIIQAKTGDDALPVAGAHVTVLDASGKPQYETYTDSSGSTEPLVLETPDEEHSLVPNYGGPVYMECEVIVEKDGFCSSDIHNVQVFDTETSILPVRMQPLIDEFDADTTLDIYIPPAGLLLTDQTRQVGPPQSRALRQVLIPEYITVHLGAPSNAAARNVRVHFPEYIKNVASSEIYPTWPRNALVANIHAIVTFAINRVYTEWYRSRGFSFDITNSTGYDQYYRDGGQIFDNISKLVDDIFNVFVRRIGFRNPFFTSFCNGTTATCNGLSQWGTVTLANQGMTPLQILRYYYPSDVELASSNNIGGITESFPGAALRVGSQGDDVRKMQNYLNRIRVNYPLIPIISNPNGVFGVDTENAVRTFQRTFNLTADGVIGNATWNKISFIFVGIARLGELDSEGQRETIGLNPPNVVLSQGSRGEHVLELQFILNAISPYYPTVPFVIQDGVFGPVLKNAVIEFQKTFELTPDGIVGPGTWNKLYAVYRGIDKNVPVPPSEIPSPEGAPPYPGTPLRMGSTGANVRLMQTYLNTIRIVYTGIPPLTVDGVFGGQTRNAVLAFQNKFLLAADGIIGPVTWDYIVKQFQFVTGNESVSLEFPGVLLRIGSAGSSVRLMQGFLSELRSPYPSLPAIAVDGIFGPNTQAAVIGFQRLFGLAPDGIIGPITWNAIVQQRNAIGTVS